MKPKSTQGKRAINNLFYACQINQMFIPSRLRRCSLIYLSVFLTNEHQVRIRNKKINKNNLRERERGGGCTVTEFHWSGKQKTSSLAFLIHIKRDGVTSHARKKRAKWNRHSFRKEIDRVNERVLWS